MGKTDDQTRLEVRMKKWILLLGIAVGFVLGSKAGRGPYMQIEGKVRDVRARPEVQKAIKTVTGRAKEQAADMASTLHDQTSDVAGKIGAKVATSMGSNSS
jgi:hypothetical protein